MRKPIKFNIGKFKIIWNNPQSIR